MAGIGKNSTQVSVTLPKRFERIFDERRDGLRWKRAQYAAAVIEWWEAQGCPPVSAADQANMLAKRVSKSLPPRYPHASATNPQLNEGAGP